MSHVPLNGHGQPHLGNPRLQSYSPVRLALGTNPALAWGCVSQTCHEGALLHFVLADGGRHYNQGRSDSKPSCSLTQQELLERGTV